MKVSKIKTLIPAPESSFTWIRYADTITFDGSGNVTGGTGMSDSPLNADNSFKEYIGFAYNKTTATESDDYTQYKWTKFKGEQGVQGPATVSYDVIPSVNMLHADKEGNILTGAITVTVYKRFGTSRTAQALNVAEEDGKKVFVLYSRNGGSTWFGVAASNVSGNVATISQEAVRQTTDGLIIRLFRGTSSSIGSVVAELPALQVVWDGQTGSQGKIGPMWYPAGKWNSESTYTRTENSYPIVEHNGRYYRPKEEGTISAGEEPSGTSSYWILVETVDIILVKALFADFGKLGSAVFSGDFMMSMNGKISGKPYEGDKTLYTNASEKAPDATSNDAGIPAYTRFCGDPDDGKGTLGYSEFVGVEWRVVAEVRVQRGVRLKMNISFSGYGSIDIIKKGSNNILNGKTSSSASRTSPTINYLSTEDADYQIVAFSSYSDSNHKLKLYSLSYYLTGYFEPYMWFNLKTGKRVGAQGNITESPKGDVEIRGTIHADNLYNSVEYFLAGGTHRGGMYYVKAKPSSIGLDDATCELNCENQTEYDNTVAFWDKLEVGKYYKWSDIQALPYGNPPTSLFNTGQDNGNEPDDIIYMMPTTWRANKVFAIPSVNNFGSDDTIYLPLPEDFQGKSVEISSWHYGQNADTIMVGCVVSPRMVRVVECYLNGNYWDVRPSGNPAVDSAITINTGKKYSFLSMELNGSWYWVMENLS